VTRAALASVCLTGLALGALAVGMPTWVFGLVSVASGVALWYGRRGLRVRAVLLAAVGLRALAIPLPPTLSGDVYRYVWDGQRIVEASTRPWAERPRDHAAADPDLFARLNSPDYASVYPPVSQSVFVAGVALGRGDTDAAVVWTKTLITLAEIVGIILASRVLPVAWVALYALHPVAVVEVAGMGHSEGLLVCALGLLVWALRRRRRGVAGVAVALAAGVKLWPAALALPVLRRGGWRAAIPMSLAGAAIAFPMLDPASLAGIRASLALYAGYFDWYAPLYDGLKAALWPVAGEGSGRAAASVLGAGWLALVGVLAVADDGSERALARSVGGTVGGYAVLSAVLHPWHLLPLLATVPLLQSVWVVSIAPLTYPVYGGLPPWLPETIGWGGGALLGLAAARHRLLDALMRRRARAKWRRIAPLLPDDARHLLDLGAGEGFVADAAAEATGARVTLADVHDYRRTPRPLVRVAAERLPFADATFDATWLVYVLHHAHDAEALLHEAVRVSRGPVVVLESVVRVPWTRSGFEWLDAVVNRLRSGADAPRPRWRSVDGWAATARSLGLAFECHDVRGVGHPTALFVIRAAEPRATTRVAATSPSP